MAIAAVGHGMWLAGGDTVDAKGTIHVAAWSTARGPTGKWQSSDMRADPQRDGPNETILGFAAAQGSRPAVAFGSRFSPTEGYPRPSTWVGTPGPSGYQWREIVADRELFGGPNIVAIGEESGGGITGGPHGYHVAGTWIGPANHAVAAVWGSVDGEAWWRDDTDPSFSGLPGTQSYADDVADGTTGLMMVGSTVEPTPKDPTKEVAAGWFSPDGSGWQRLTGLGGGSRAVLDTVRAVGTGWLAGGQVDTPSGEYPVLWSIGPTLAPTAMVLPPSPGSIGPHGAVYDLAVTSSDVVAAGLTPSGSPIIWSAPVRARSVAGPWRVVRPPPGTGAGWVEDRVATDGEYTVLVLYNAVRSEMWITTDP